MLEKIKAIVLAALGIAEFPKKDGKVNFSDDQKSTLEKEFGKLGPEFVSKFEEALNAEISNRTAQDQATAANDLAESIRKSTQKEIDALKVKLDEANRQIIDLAEKTRKLSEKPEDDETAVDTGKNGKVVKFKLNMNHQHNKIAKSFLEGNANLEIAATTMDVTELQSEFGTYLSQFGITLEIFKKLTQKTESEQYMTTKLAITEWKASMAVITSVVQQFSAKWTPLGSATFTPLTIKNYRHKINVPITPDEISDSWLGYLYDESLTPEEMPITRYIIENLIIPKVMEDRELLLIGKGEFEALGPVSTDDPGQATGKSMNGFCTILKAEKASGTSSINFIDLETITDANILDQMNAFVDAIDELYKTKPMNIFCSRERYLQYKRAYQKLYPVTKNEDKSGDMIDFSLQRLVPLPSMHGEDLFFATPKENFIRLKHKNNGSSKITMQTVDYDVKVFAEWWEGVGFAVAEAVFAYVPEEESGSGS